MLVHARKRIRPRTIQIAADTPNLPAYREALKWWERAPRGGYRHSVGPAQHVPRDRGERMRVLLY